MEATEDLRNFIAVTATAWMDSYDGLIKRNSYGVQLLAARLPGSDFTYPQVCNFGYSRPDMPHDALWYRANAHGKNLACLATGLDSHEAVRLWQGNLLHVVGVFPWGGAIIDKNYGIIVGVSGFKEDEDILFARTIRNRAVMLLDRLGQECIDDARAHGEQPGEAGADRFTGPALTE